MRLLIFLISFGMLVVSLVTVLDYWKYDEVLQDVTSLMANNVDAAQVNAQIEAAIDTDNPEDARMYLAIARRFGYAVDEQQYMGRIEALETPWQTARRHAERFVGGFIDGEADSSTGVAGAITADFTVVGDVRDLNEQYELYNAGKNVNELIVTLAGVGIGLTAATVASAGTASPAKSGVSALKLASRTGRLTPKLQRLLMRQGQAVFDYRGFLLASRGERGFEKIRRAAVNAYNPRAARALGDTTQRVNNIRESTSMLDTINLLRYVENTDDLRRLEKVSLKYGVQTKGILKLAGKGAIGTVRVLRKSTEFLVGLAATLIALLATLFSVASFFRR